MQHKQIFALLQEFTRSPAAISLLRYFPDSMRHLAVLSWLKSIAVPKFQKDAH